MNLVQLAKKARLGCDAVLPGGYVSSQWSDEELVDIVNEAYDEILRRFRLVRKKWGMRTVKQTDSAFEYYGETYTPSTALALTSASNLITMPPDFGELTRILCLNNRTVRFFPAQMEGAYFIDREQESFDDDGNVLLASEPDGLVFHYDIVRDRELLIVPSVSSTFNLQIDYTPLKRPLYYSGTGTVTQAGTTALTGSSTTWLSDGVYTEDTGNRAELITLDDAFSTLGEVHDSIRLDRDYPRVQTITSNTAATMRIVATIAAGTPFIMAMVPVLPVDVHRWLAGYTSALMLKKINPEVAQKYGADLITRFEESIQPTASRRQSQESAITEDAEEFGVSGDH